MLLFDGRQSTIYSFVRAWVAGNSLSLAFLALAVRVYFLLFLHKAAEDAYFFVSVGLKIETIFLAEPQLQQVVIQTFFGNADLLGCVLE